MAENFDYLLKYILIGDAGVGKSNLLLRYTQGKFIEEYQTTLGVEFGANNLKMNKKIYRLQIWDTTGQENFRSITRTYYKNSVCAIIVYDISNAMSFDSIESWIKDTINYGIKSVLKVLVGNKIDLDTNRKITYEQGENLAKKYGMLFFETSAKTGFKVKDVFEESAKVIADKIKRGEYDLTDQACGIKLGLDHKNNSIVLNGDSKKKNENHNCC